MYAQTRSRQRTSGPADGAPRRDPIYYFRFAPGFNTLVLAYMLDSLVRVSRRDI